MKLVYHWLFAALLGAAVHPARADDFTARCLDRTAIERVYHAHRLGPKQPFEQELACALIEQLVRQELHKEAVLRNSYGVEVTPAMLEAEVQRIDSTTRAPEVLAELKAALGNDVPRFSRAMAVPIVVERLLRERFDNDDRLHVVQRREMERIRTALTNAATGIQRDQGHEAPVSKPKSERRIPALAAATNLLGTLTAILEAEPAGSFSEVTWQLGSRPTPALDSPTLQQIAPTRLKAQAGPYAIEGTLQPAQVLSTPKAGESGRKQESYFEDLPGKLQEVLLGQLHEPGDVSALIEMPHGFQLYVLRSRTDNALTAATLSVPKRSYESWLAGEKSQWIGSTPTPGEP